MELNLTPKPAPAARDVTTESFEKEVLQRSLEKPIIVDFWAPWCGPCRQLMPLLEKAVAESGGAVEMVKVNVDACPELAQALRIQSVPTVYAFFQGQPVDGFTGARPESDLRALVKKLMTLAGAQGSGESHAPDAQLVARLMGEADAFFAAADYAQAMGRYAAALEADHAQADALGGIGWCLVAEGDMDAARGMFEDLEDGQKNAPRLKGLGTLLSLSAAAAGLPETAALRARAAAAPGDLQARLDLARRLAAEGALEEAVDTLTAITRSDRAWDEKNARPFLLSLFEAMGPRHPLTVRGRRALSSVLFS